ncbi:hypothetical protein [Labrys neptuniae]
MTLAQWLKSTVADQKMREPSLFETTDHLSQSPLAAIARKLAASGGRYEGSENSPPQRQAPAVGVSAAVLARHIRASETRMAGLIEQLIRRQEQNEAQMAALLDALVDGFAMRPTAATTAEEADGLDDTARDLEQRLAGMAAGLDTKTASAPAPAVRDDLSEQITALTREIAELRRSHPAAAAAQGDLAGLKAEIADLSRQVAGIGSPEQFARLDKKLDLLARQAQDPAVLAALQRETADIRTRLGDLVRQPELSQELHRKIDAKLDVLQQAVDGVQAATDASLAALLAKFEALDQRGTDEVALAALERQIAGMAEKVDGLAAGGIGAAGLREAVGQAVAASPLAGLSEEFQCLYRDLRKLQEDEVRDTRGALDALQSLLNQLGSRLAAVEDLVRVRSGVVVSGPPDSAGVSPLFGRERPDDIAWSDDLPLSLAGDGSQHRLAEPSPSPGRPSQVSALGPGPVPVSGTRSAFIAAARRAARAANEAEGAITREETDAVTANESFYKRHKRPILLGLAAVTMMLGALQGGKAGATPGGNRPPPRLSTPAAAQAARPTIAVTKPEQAGLALAWFEEARRLDRPDAPTQDLAKAAGLYRQAAQAGYAPALFLLGLAYDKGRGVGQDAVLAGLWYQRAAEHGSVNAMYNLAVLYANGAVMGTPDYEQAARWFHQAADKGHTASQYNYALLAARGLGTPRDLAVSYRFLALAAAAGDDDALMKMAELEPRLTPQQRAAVEGGKVGHKPC